MLFALTDIGVATLGSLAEGMPGSLGSENCVDSKTKPQTLEFQPGNPHDLTQME
jgi:hypothetical protein